MATKRPSANRMELMRLKKQLETARRGHRLLKDKRDGMMQIFLNLVRENLRLRHEVDRLLTRAAQAMAWARAVLEPEVLGEALQSSTRQMTVDVNRDTIMAVAVPEIKVTDSLHDSAGPFPYSPAQTSGDVDVAIDALRDALPVMLQLASVEKQVLLLAGELERTRRRVNSLEYVMIPETAQHIRDITLRMDENERDNQTRLMKVKDMIVEQEILQQRARNERAKLEQA